LQLENGNSGVHALSIEANLSSFVCEVQLYDKIDITYKKMQDLMEKFISEKPEIWNEDIGEEKRVYSKETKP